MALDGNVLAAEALAAMGGQQGSLRTTIFQKMMGAVVNHIRKNIPLPPPPYGVGDLFYASDANTLTRLAYPGNGQVLGGAGGVPAWQSGGGEGGSGITRVAPDANDLIVCMMNDTLAPFINTGTSGTSGNFDSIYGTNLSADMPMFNVRGLFASGALFVDTSETPGSTIGIEASGSSSITPAYPMTLSLWIRQNSFITTGAMDIAGKPYRSSAMWSPPYVSLGLGLNLTSTNTAEIFSGLTVGGTNSATTPISMSFNRMLLQQWCHIGMTYDGFFHIVYINGQVAKSRSQSGAIDYNGGSGGNWYVVAPQHNPQSHTQGVYFQDLRIANVARSAAWFQSVWRGGVGLP